MNYIDSPILQRFTRKVELPAGKQVTLAEVTRLIERYSKPVRDAWPVSSDFPIGKSEIIKYSKPVRDAWPVSLASRFFRHTITEEKK